LIWRGTLLIIHLIGLSFSKTNESDLFWHWFPENHYLDSFFRWDSGWYNDIVKNGYSYDPNQQSNVAFFPLYPLLVKLIAAITSLDEPIAALLLSNLCLVIALFFVYKISSIYLSKKGSDRVLVLMLLFPTSFFYSSFYTESLYLLVISASFYFFLNKKYLLSGIWGCLATLVRVPGLLLLFSFGFELGWNYFTKKEKLTKEIFYLLLIPCGLIAYMLFLYFKFKEPLAFLTIQKLWGRSDNIFPLITLIIAFKNINFLFPKDPANAINFLDFFFSVSFLGLLIVALIKNLLNSSLLVFSFLSILLPLTTGTTISIMRYILPLFPIFIVLGYLCKNNYFYGFLVFFFTYLLSILFLWFGNWGWVG
jgi:Gpi18-like mannosyltransferase